VVNICQREHRQWDAVKRRLTSDAVGVEGMLTTNKKAFAHHADMVQRAACENIVGLKNHIDLELENLDFSRAIYTYNLLLDCNEAVPCVE